MKDWDAVWAKCTPEQLDDLAVLRVMECTNGTIQHAFRNGDHDALSIEATRKAMKFSMGSIKRLQIYLTNHKIINFDGWLGEELKEARDLYIRGTKQHDDCANEEFWVLSHSVVEAIGEKKLREAAVKLKLYASHTFPEHTVDWGLGYLLSWL